MNILTKIAIHFLIGFLRKVAIKVSKKLGNKDKQKLKDLYDEVIKQASSDKDWHEKDVAARDYVKKNIATIESNSLAGLLVSIIYNIAKLKKEI